MGQVTIYLDDDTERRLRSAAESEGIPVSRWIGEVLHKEMRSAWPESVRQLAGAWPDFPDIGTIRDNQTRDIPRKSL